MIDYVLILGYDRAEVDRLISEGKLTRENKSVSQSVSSLDKEDEDMDTIRKVSLRRIDAIEILVGINFRPRLRNREY